MPNSRQTHPSAPPTYELLRGLADRCRGQSVPSNAEMQKALERGATSLIALEARLQRVQAKSAEVPTLEAELECEQLANEIESLLAALADLRACAAGGTSPLAHGFVLSRDR